MNSNNKNDESQPPSRTKNVRRPARRQPGQCPASTGPRTEEGKAISKYNNLRHGTTRFMFCLPGEDKEDFEDERAEYYAYWQPANPVERGLVDATFSARQRIEHLIRREYCLIREQMVRSRPKTGKIYEKLSTGVDIALAVKALCDNSNAVERTNGQEARLERSFYKAMKQLIQLKGIPAPIQGPGTQPTAPTPQIENSQTEPIPTNEHPIEDLRPIENVTAPVTSVLKPQVQEPKLTTGNCQLTTENLQTEPIPTNEHPIEDLKAIGNATAPVTIVLKPQVQEPKLTTDNCQLTTENFQTEPIPVNEHPIEDLEPIGNATAPVTIVLKPQVQEPKLTTDNCQLTTGPGFRRLPLRYTRARARSRYAIYQTQRKSEPVVISDRSSSL